MTQSEQRKSPGSNPEAWGEVVTGYEATAEKVTGLYVDLLLEAVEPIEGKRLLDVACGPGVVSLEAARRGGRLTALDFSSEMVGRTRERLEEAGAEETECVVADFASTDFDDDSFDVAVSNLGLMFAPDPERAFAELARVLDSGGRLALTTWTAPKRQGFFSSVGAAMRRALPDFEPPGPPIWAQFSNPDELTDYLEAGGLVDAVVETHQRGWPVPSAEWFVEDIDRTSPAITYLFESLTDDEAARFKESLHELLIEQYGDGSFELETEAHIARAEAP